VDISKRLGLISSILFCGPWFHRIRLGIQVQVSCPDLNVHTDSKPDPAHQVAVEFPIGWSA
jgi:hypothetical protein